MSPDEGKTKEQLIDELAQMRQRLAEVEASETERKRAEGALRESEEFRSSLLNNSPNPILVINPDTSVRYVNPALEQLTGFSSAEVIGRKAPYLWWTEETLPKTSRDLEGAMQKGAVRLEELFQKNSGERFWVEISSTPVRIDNEFRYYLANWIDITERKRAEEALREETKKLQALVDGLTSTGIATDIVSNDYKILLQNQVLMERFGDCAGKICYEEYIGLEAPCDICPMREAIKNNRVESAELTGVDGRNYEIFSAPLPNPDGSVDRAIEVIIDITERKRVEEALRESEALYRTLFENSGTALVIEEADDTISMVNSEFESLTGWPNEEVAGRKRWQDFVIPGEVSRIEEYSQARRENESAAPGSYETQLVCRDGQVRDILVTAGLIPETKRVVASILDITERKQAEAELRESEKRYRELADFLPQTVYEIDERGNITFFNRHGFQSFGYTLEDFNNGVTALQMFVPEDLDRAIEDGRRVLGGEEVDGDEYTLVRKDGTTFPVMIYATPITRGNRIVGLRGLIIDITERKQAEAELRESEERYRALVNLGATVGEAIVMLQDSEWGDAMHIFVSNEWPRVTGYSRKELLGISFFDLLHPGHRAASLKRHGRKMRGEIVPGLFEMSIIRKDGTEVPVEVTSAYTTYKGERANVAFIRNITERKQAEEREKEVQQELNLSGRLASIGELAAGVAHEINNPLTGILGFSERLMRKSAAGEIRRDLERIHNEAWRAARVVENLLTFARRREPKKEYLDINEILARTVELRAYELRTGNIDLVTELTPSLPKTVGDFGQIQQVFLNIILNAEQAMTEANRGGKLTIKSQRGKGCIRVSFADDGPGIAAGDFDRVFDPFFTTRGERGGTGLGLSACHGIVTEHGGRIYVGSKPGQGATFYVELPLTDEEARQG